MAKRRSDNPTNQPPPPSVNSTEQKANSDESRIKTRLRELKLQEDIIDNEIRRADTAEELAAAENQLFESLQKRLSLEAELAKVMGDSETYDERIKQLDVLKDSLKQYNNELKKTAAQQKLGADAASKMANSIGLVESSTVGTIESLMGKGGVTNALKGFKEKTLDLINPVNLAANAIDQFAENAKKSMKSMVDSSAAARKEYGKFGEEITKDSAKITDSIRKFNMSTEDAFAIETTMVKTIGGYREMTDEQQKSVGEQIAAFSKLGVSQEDTTDLYQQMVNIQGKSTKSAGQLQRSLISLANKTGVPLNKLVTTITKNADKLALFGKNANKIGGQLAVIEERTKLSGESMLDFSNSLMTFDKSSQVAGDLNALLGQTVISSDKLQRLAAKGDVTGVYKEIFSGFEKAGVSTESLREQPQLLASIAESTGQSTQDVLKSLDAYEKGEYDLAITTEDLASKTEISVEEMNKQAKAAMSATENWEAFTRQIDLSAETYLQFEQISRSVTSTFRDNMSSANSLTQTLSNLSQSGLGSKVMGGLKSVGSAIGTGYTKATSALSSSSSVIGKGIGRAAGAVGSVASSVGGKISGAVSSVTKPASSALQFLSDAVPEARVITEAFAGSSAPVANRLKDLANAVKSNAVLQKALKLGTSTAGKVAGAVPYFGAALNLGSAAYRFFNGDIKGALVDAGSAVTNFGFPMAGTLMQGYMAARDFGAFQGTALGINDQAYGGAYSEETPPAYADGTGGFVKSRTPMMIGGVPSIVGESGVEMVMTEAKLATMLKATIKDSVEAAIGAMAVNNPQGVAGNAKIELVLNSEILKSFILKTVGRELSPLV
jgi:hypothetical protein